MINFFLTIAIIAVTVFTGCVGTLVAENNVKKNQRIAMQKHNSNISIKKSSEGITTFL